MELVEEGHFKFSTAMVVRLERLEDLVKPLE